MDDDGPGLGAEHCHGDTISLAQYNLPDLDEQCLLQQDLKKPSATTTHHTQGSYDPFTSAGRSSIYRSVLRSGPARDSKGYSEISVQRESVGSNAGWRRGIRMCCFAVGICLITEITLLVWALISDIGPPGSGLLYQGKCGKVKTTTIWLLLPLNIVATILISTSNYVMQCLVAPDRDEVDTAHAQATWILVGGMRTRSLSFASRTRRLLWMALGLSSIPIHLLLNSAFYNSEQPVDQGVLIVSEDFASDTTWQNCSNDTFTTSLAPSFACSLFKEFNLARLIYMTPDQCMRQYSNGFQANGSGVIVITDKSTDRYFSLPGPGLFSASLPASKKPFCSPVPSVLNSTEVLISDARFGVSILAADGFVDMTSSFYSNCEEGNTGDGNVLVPPSPRKDGTYPSSIIYPSSYYNNTNGLYFYEGSVLSNFTSIRSVFDAFTYRFFATAAFNNYDMLHPAVDAAKRWDPRSWLCAEKDLRDGISCDPSRMLPLSADWTITPASIPVKACYVLPTDQQCSLYYSPLILALTTGLDVLKLFSMLLALRVVRAPFATIGDAIQSFLERPDPYTKHLCLLSSHQAQEWSEASLMEIEAQRIKGQRAWTLKQSQQRPKLFAVTAPIWNSVLWPNAVPRPDCARWIRTSRRWYCVAAKTRWTMFLIFYIGLTVPTATIFVYGIKNLNQQRAQDFWQAGFLAPNPNALFIGAINIKNVVSSALLINLPQCLFSMLYYLFNGLITMMHTSDEWGLMTRHRKALRVSRPHGAQRSTYWLQLPWSYSIPLIFASGSLHWLLGRSLYIVKVDVYGHLGKRREDMDFIAVGYSLLSMVFIVVLLGMMALMLAWLACRKLNDGGPLGGLNSLAIAAACHADPDEKDVAMRPVMWGVTREATSEIPGHCSFSGQEVSRLIEGEIYH